MTEKRPSVEQQFVPESIKYMAEAYKGFISAEARMREELELAETTSSRYSSVDNNINSAFASMTQEGGLKQYLTDPIRVDWPYGRHNLVERWHPEISRRNAVGIINASYPGLFSSGASTLAPYQSRYYFPQSDEILCYKRGISYDNTLYPYKALSDNSDFIGLDRIKDTKPDGLLVLKRDEALRQGLLHPIEISGLASHIAISTMYDDSNTVLRDMARGYKTRIDTLRVQREDQKEEARAERGRDMHKALHTLVNSMPSFMALFLDRYGRLPADPMCGASNLIDECWIDQTDSPCSQNRVKYGSEHRLWINFKRGKLVIAPAKKMPKKILGIPIGATYQLDSDNGQDAPDRWWCTTSMAAGVLISKLPPRTRSVVEQVEALE